eukprot:TRINITY_DN4024_c0_g1_i1.p1 TRINITY_DN4024_c0_g1~~TRINITY_DN4024_c0_g1_i1.p1  ORF type:complete len:1167 (+),score=412.47 TRINITY_DN4024_c0_g1_i1:425-3502(+)
MNAQDELEIKQQLKYTPELAKAVKDWINGVLEAEVVKGNIGEALKSGVILCNLVNKLMPNSVGSIYEGSLQSRQMTNISAYLGAAEKFHRLYSRNVILFEVSDLTEQKNIMAVLTSIESLAKAVQDRPSYAGPKMADTSAAKNMMGHALLGVVMEIDENAPEEWTPKEKEVIDWANSQLAKAVPPLSITNIQSLQSGIKIIELLRILTGVQKLSTGIVEKPQTVMHFMANEVAIIQFLHSTTKTGVGQEKKPEKNEKSKKQNDNFVLSPGDIANGDRERIIELLMFIGSKFDMDLMYKMMLQDMEEEAVLESGDIDYYLPEDQDTEEEGGEVKEAVGDIGKSQEETAQVEGQKEELPETQKQPEAQKESTETERDTHRDTETDTQRDTERETQRETDRDSQSEIVETPKTPQQGEKEGAQDKGDIKSPLKKDKSKNRKSLVVHHNLRSRSKSRSNTPDSKSTKVKNRHSLKEATKPLTKSSKEVLTSSKEIKDTKDKPKDAPKDTPSKTKDTPAKETPSKDSPKAVERKSKRTESKGSAKKPKNISRTASEVKTHKKKKEFIITDSETQPSNSNSASPAIDRRRPEGDRKQSEGEIVKKEELEVGSQSSVTETAQSEDKEKETDKERDEEHAQKEVKEKAQEVEESVDAHKEAKDKANEEQKKNEDKAQGEAKPTEKAKEKKIARTPSVLKELQVQARMREHVAKEILSTEQSYLKSIKALVDGLIQPLQHTKILTEEEFSSIFSNLIEISQYHDKFIQVIAPKIEVWTPKSTIGKEFHANTDFLKCYKPYLCNFNTAQLALQLVQKKSIIFDQLSTAWEDKHREQTGLGIPDILIMPVQRIPRYIMLLYQLQKFTMEGTKDHKLLGETAANISSTLEAINNSIDPTLLPSMEKMFNAIKLIKEVTEADLPTNLKRVFIKDAPFTIVKLSNPEKKKWTGKKVKLFLFNDYAVFCARDSKKKKKETEGFEFMEACLVSQVQVQSILKLKKKDITLKWKSEEWVIEAKTDDECQFWGNILPASKNES